MKNDFFVNFALCYGWTISDFRKSAKSCFVSAGCNVLIDEAADKVISDLCSLEESKYNITNLYLEYMKARYKQLTEDFYFDFVKKVKKLFENEDFEELRNNYFIRHYNQILISKEELELVKDMNILAAIDTSLMKDYVLIDGQFIAKYLTQEELDKNHSLEKIASMTYTDMLNVGEENFMKLDIFADMSCHTRFHLKRLAMHCFALHKVIFDSFKDDYACLP